jgi:hypothetical protein
MTDEQRMLALTASRWCAAGTGLAAVSLALAVFALAVLTFGSARGFAPWLWWLVAVLGGAGAWYRFRLAFDAKTFGDIAGRDADSGVSVRATAFDAALAALRATSPLPSRPLAERARGAHALVVRAGAIAVVQSIAALLAVLPA